MEISSPLWIFLLLLPRLTFSLSWSSLTCPKAGLPFSPSCTTSSFVTDVAITLFFQIESTGTSGGEFSCSTNEGKAILCARNWTQSESGSAGSCFFYLPKGQSYTCLANGGQINVIDADSTPLSSNTLSNIINPVSTNCPGTMILDVNDGNMSSCVSQKQDQDVWISTSWTAISDSQNSTAAFVCAIDEKTVCAYSAAAIGLNDLSSCSFLVPAQSELLCTAIHGKTIFLGSNQIAIFNEPYASANLPSAGVACPPAHVNTTNDCDCEFDNDNNVDVLVNIVSTSIDAGFNAFHCFIDGANVCGWGSNTNMNYSLGSCTFILPAGETYGCTMEWGAASFPETAVSLLSGSVFEKSRKGLDMSVASKVTLDEMINPLSNSPSFPIYIAKSSAPRPIDEERVERLWREWRLGKENYENVEEEIYRRKNFVHHVATADNVVHKIRNHPHLDEFGLQNRFNQFADWSRSEWESIYRKKRPTSQVTRSSEELLVIPSPPPAPLPPFDYADKGVVTLVKDQGQCGSCWSFSTTGAVESAWAIAGNPLVSLSEQYLVSCDTTSDGCNGGWPYSAIDYLASTGAFTEASYPYISGNGSSMPCESNGRIRATVNVTGYQPIVGNTSIERESVLADWLAAYSPVSILVDDMTQLWWTYVGGIMTACCDIATNHAVLLTGYDYNATSNLSYWKIKNSWSSTWGIDGYLWLERGTNECGIGTYPIIPSVKGGKMPSPPPPPPPPPPPVPPYECPSDSFSVNTSSIARCEWRNQTFGGIMPSLVGEYCDYFNSGYFGYTFDGKLSENEYPCWPSFTAAGDGGSAWFCTLTAHSGSFNTWPATAKADCSQLNKGVIAYEWASE
jgi:hypothetical protein